MASSFATKKLLSMYFAKAKVIGYTTSFFKSSEQLLFGTTSLFFYVFLTYLHKRKTTGKQKIVCSRSTRQKQCKSCEWNVCKGYNKASEWHQSEFTWCLSGVFIVNVQLKYCAQVCSQLPFLSVRLSWHLPLQIQQQKHQNTNCRNCSKSIIKRPERRPLTYFECLCYYL